jgi:hypothetical protein
MVSQQQRQSNDEIVVQSQDLDHDEKEEVKHVEDQEEDGVIMRSPFDDLPIKKTWIIFHKVSIMCLFAAFSAAAE